jgi:hypothetical protein
MNSQELRALQESYSQVYELDENRMASRMGKMPSAPAKVGKATHSIKDIPVSREPSPEEKAKARKALKLKESDLYDVILSHLLDEGYADTEQAAEAIMVNMSEDWRESIMEISQKTATNAFATRATGEFEYDTNPSDYTKSGKSKADEGKRRIEKKFGKKAGAHAERAAHARIFGRKGAGGMPSAD